MRKQTPPPPAAPAHDFAEVMATLREIEARRAVVLGEIIKREEKGEHLQPDNTHKVNLRNNAIALLNFDLWRNRRLDEQIRHRLQVKDRLRSRASCGNAQVEKKAS
jgi:hypothetical protein